MAHNKKLFILFPVNLNPNIHFKIFIETEFCILFTTSNNNCKKLQVDWLIFWYLNCTYFSLGVVWLCIVIPISLQILGGILPKQRHSSDRSGQSMMLLHTWYLLIIMDPSKHSKHFSWSNVIEGKPRTSLHIRKKFCVHFTTSLDTNKPQLVFIEKWSLKIKSRITAFLLAFIMNFYLHISAFIMNIQNLGGFVYI